MEFWSDGFFNNRKGLGLLQKTRNGNLIVATDTLNTGLPIYIYGEQPNPWSVPKFTKIGYDPACLTGSGATTLAIEMQSDLVNWRFAGAGQVLYNNCGTVASPLTTGIAGIGLGALSTNEVSLWGSLNPMMIPAFMMYKGCRGRIKCLIQKTGATGLWEVWIRMGGQLPAVSITGNDQIQIIGSLINASGRQYQVDTEFTVTAQGKSVYGAATGETTAAFLTKNSLTPNGQGTSVAADKSGYFSTRSDCYFNINIKGAVGDTFSLINYSLELMPL